MKKIQRFFLNAMIMTATSLLMNAVGVWFNLYISGKIGAEGMGVFQLIMSVYSFTVTFAASGINLASTRLVAEEAASPNGNVKGAMRRCFGYALLFGGAASLFLFFAAPFIGETCLGSVQTVRPLKTMALSMPFIAMSCALNGYFTAVGRVAKSAASQIFEQFLKISLSIVGLTFLMPPGLEYACLAITGSGVIAEGLSFVSSLVLYLGDSRGFRRKGAPKNRLTGRLFGIALPMAMSSYLRSGLATVKNLLVPVRLQAGGSRRAPPSPSSARCTASPCRSSSSPPPSSTPFPASSSPRSPSATAAGRASPTSSSGCSPLTCAARSGVRRALRLLP